MASIEEEGEEEEDPEDELVKAFLAALERPAAGQACHKVVENRTQHSHTVATRNVSHVLGAALDALEQLPNKDDAAFVKSMGCRIKPRGLADDRRLDPEERGEEAEAAGRRRGLVGGGSPSPAAGAVAPREAPHSSASAKPCKRLYQGQAGTTGAPSGVAVLFPSNQEHDISVPMAISATPAAASSSSSSPLKGVAGKESRHGDQWPLPAWRARGACAEGFSEEAERHVLHQPRNQEILRYAVDPRAQRQRKGVVALSRCAGGAGRPSSSVNASASRSSLGSSAAGLRPQRRPGPLRRTRSEVGTLLNREAMDGERAREQANRRATDKAFADLCSAAEQNKQDMSIARRRFARSQPASAASHLSWEE